MSLFAVIVFIIIIIIIINFSIHFLNKNKTCKSVIRDCCSNTDGNKLQSGTSCWPKLALLTLLYHEMRKVHRLIGKNVKPPDNFQTHSGNMNTLLQKVRVSDHVNIPISFGILCYQSWRKRRRRRFKRSSLKLMKILIFWGCKAWTVSFSMLWNLI